MTTILHLSALYAEEGWALPGARDLDLTGIEGTNCYCSPAAEEALKNSIQSISPGGLCWIDTGDYHYVSKLRMESIEEPFVLALLDNHPDNQEDAFGSGLLSCGGWVKTALEGLEMLKDSFLNTPHIPPGLPVFLSIDLDVLSRDYARTDWDQGSMSLQELLEITGRIAAEHRVLGVDVCGGITAAKGATAEDLRINAGTRAAIQAYLESHPLLEL